jgi:ribosome-binding ATPase YchF (GTP1/OBG family)
MAWTEHEMVILHGFQFLTLKPIVAVLNIAESELGREAPRDIAELLGNKKVGFVAFSAKIELEIMDLSAEERPEFLKSLGIESCARDKLVKACFKMLDLVTFYTIKGDEARAWPVKVGTKALDAAGKIHSDIKKGFIRAEVVNYKEFVESGSSFHEARAKGHFRLEGRDYPVKDGDIIDFRFSV